MMADDPEKPASADTGLSTRDKMMFGRSLLTSLLNEVAGLLKLQLGLQTWAVVLFVKVLIDVHSPKLVLTALVLSALLFGGSALWCLEQLLGLVQLRATMFRHWAGDKDAIFDVDYKSWEANIRHSGKWMYRSFLLAILFAVIFIIGVLVTR
jgi:hypothetical protein